MKRNVRGAAVDRLTGYMVLNIFSITSSCSWLANLTLRLRKVATVSHARQWLGSYNKDDMFCHRRVSLKSRSSTVGSRFKGPIVLKTIGPFRYPVTSYNVTHVGVQLVQQGQVQVDWYELHWFGSPTTQSAHQHVWFCTIWLDRPKSLFTGNTVTCGSLRLKKMAFM